MRQPLFIIFCLVLLNCSVARAENYYLQAVQSAKLTTEQIQKSTKKVKEHKDVKVIDELEVPPFHKRGEWEKESLSKTFCTGCHLSPPHNKNLRSRAFLNMHTEYIACETCHLRPENIQFKYQWLDYRNQQTVTPDAILFRQAMSMDDKPKEGETRRQTDKMVKIVPYYTNAPAMILRDHDFAQKSLSIWKDGTVDERTKRRAKIHAPLKEKGPECKACHQTEQPLLDLTLLGANKRQSSRIQKHIVPQFFKRYTEDDQKIRINNLLK